MKVIKYKIDGNTVSIPYTDENLSVAEKEADNGEFYTEDDGHTEVVKETRLFTGIIPGLAGNIY